MTTYQSKDGDTLDRICYNYYGTTYSGQVEATLEANRALDLGQHTTLPAGLLITLPDISQKTTEVVRLFS